MMMTDREENEFHLSHAPIVEALIAIKFAEPLPESALSGLEECAGRITDKYPTREEIRSQQLQVTLGASAQSNLGASRREGFFCKTTDGHRVVHLKLDGFGFSELTPYSSWDSFFSEASRLWQDYVRTIGARPVDKWSIRYINRFSWPEGERIEDYLKVYPNVPKGLPKQLRRCFLRLEMPVTKPSKGLFTQQVFTAPPPEAGKVSVVLDHEFTYSALSLTESDLWAQIQQSREIKNEFFRASVTKKGLESCK
jgi:uncharacterized protein (TIGR04255 family)